MDPLIEELQREVPKTQVGNAISFVLKEQNVRSRGNIYKALRLLSDKYPNKRIDVSSVAFGYQEVDTKLDRNSIQIILKSAPSIEKLSFYGTGTMPDNQLEDGKIVHGKSVLLINGAWISLTRNQRNTFVETKQIDNARVKLRDTVSSNRIFAENPVELGFAIHNQIHIFMDLFDSKSNAGEIFLYIVEKALERMSFEFAASLSSDKIADYIYQLRTTSYRNEILTIEQQMKISQDNQVKLLNTYTSEVRNYEFIAQKLTALRGCQDNKANSISRIAKEIDSLVEQKKYLEFYIEKDRRGNNVFCAVTNRIFVVFKDLVYDFKYYTVKINLAGGQLTQQGVTFDHPEINERGFLHPHANCIAHDGHGTICWGAVQTQVAKMCGEGDIMKLLDLCYFFLQSYNEKNPYVKIDEFKQVETLPFSSFKKRPEPTTEEYKAYKETIPVPVNVAPPINGTAIDLDASGLVCEGCGESEDICVCDTEHPLVPREVYERS